MWQTGGCETKGEGIKNGAESASQPERKARFDVVDLYEELLSKRAELGHRPIIYVASERDLECTLIGMFESDFAEDARSEVVPFAESVEQLRRRLQ